MGRRRKSVLEKNILIPAADKPHILKSHPELAQSSHKGEASQCLNFWLLPSIASTAREIAAAYTSALGRPVYIQDVILHALVSTHPSFFGLSDKTLDIHQQTSYHPNPDHTPKEPSK